MTPSNDNTPRIPAPILGMHESGLQVLAGALGLRGSVVAVLCLVALLGALVVLP